MAVIVESPLIDAPCTEMWVDPSVVLDALGGTGITAAEVEEATIEATYILWVLSGFKFHGWQVWEEDYLLSPGQTEFFLSKTPVYTVSGVGQLESTSVSGDAVPVDNWTYDGRHVHLGNCVSPFYSDMFYCYPCDATTRLRVTYVVKPFLAPGAARVTAKLAGELYKARAGSRDCSLPDRIQTITRQGVSWTLLDPQDFLTYGRVGIGQVDGWLAVTNRFGVTRTIDTYYAPVVLNSVLLSCPSVAP